MLKLFIILITIGQITLSFAQIGIGTNLPHSSAVLDVKSDNKGFLPPRMTTAERDNISNSAEGLLIYNTDHNCIEFFTGGVNNTWQSLCPNTPPVASNIMVSGVFASGEQIDATYDYTDLELHPEDNSILKWYLADNLTGTKTEISSALNSSSYIIQAADVGKFLFFSVTPKDNLGGIGEEVFSIGEEITLSSTACGPNISSIIVAAGQGWIRIRCADNIVENRTWNGNTLSSNYSYKKHPSGTTVNITSWDNTSRGVKTIGASEMSQLSEFSGSNSGTYNTPNCHSGQINGHPITISGNGYIRINPTTKAVECYYNYVGNFCNGAGGSFTTNLSSTTCHTTN